MDEADQAQQYVLKRRCSHYSRRVRKVFIGLPKAHNGATSRQQCWLQVTLEMSMVTVLPQLPENLHQRRLPPHVKRIGQAFEFTQGGAQAADAHAELVDVLGLDGAGGSVGRSQFAGVGQDLVKA